MQHSSTVAKEFLKSVHICQSHHKKPACDVFLITHGVVNFDMFFSDVHCVRHY